MLSHVKHIVGKLWLLVTIKVLFPFLKNCLTWPHQSSQLQSFASATLHNQTSPKSLQPTCFPQARHLHNPTHSNLTSISYHFDEISLSRNFKNLFTTEARLHYSVLITHHINLTCQHHDSVANVPCFTWHSSLGLHDNMPFPFSFSLSGCFVLDFFFFFF